MLAKAGEGGGFDPLEWAMLGASLVAGAVAALAFLGAMRLGDRLSGEAPRGRR